MRRVEDERPRLRAAEPAVEADQLLERAALVERRVVEAADHDVGDVREAVGAQQVLRRALGENGGERILALDAALVELVGAVAGRARPRRARPSARAASRCAGARAARGSGSGGAASISSSVSRCVGLHQVDRARGCRSRARRRRGRRRRSWRASSSLRPVASSTAWPTIACCSSPPAYAGDRGRGQRALDELVEPVAVALLERRALGLAVVGEDDDLVRARRVAARALDAPELLVELAQRLERVGALEAGVVGDLVVAGEGRVDRGPPAHHVGEHAEDDQVADERRTSPRAGTGRCRRDARAGARRGASARRRGPLEHDLPQEEHQRRVTLKPLARNAR